MTIILKSPKANQRGKDSVLYGNSYTFANQSNTKACLSLERILKIVPVDGVTDF